MVRVVRTDELDAHELDDLRRMLKEAFDGDLTDHDFSHCLGGIHAIGTERGQLVAHGAMVPRTFDLGGEPISVGYLEGVAVAFEHRRRGWGDEVMAELEGSIEALAYDLLALSPTDAGTALYTTRGWVPWRGATGVSSPQGVVRTPDDDGGVYVLPPIGTGKSLDVTRTLVCDWREGDVW